MSSTDHTLTPGHDVHLHHHAQPDVRRTLPAEGWTRAEVITVPVLRAGVVVADGGLAGLADLEAARRRRADDVGRLDPGVRRIVNPHRYHVSITGELFDLKQKALAAL